MNLYMVLFFMGFMLAVGLLAYATTQVAELAKKTDDFGNLLKERYSQQAKKHEKQKLETENEEAIPEAEI